MRESTKAEETVEARVDWMVMRSVGLRADSMAALRAVYLEAHLVVNSAGSLVVKKAL